MTQPPGTTARAMGLKRPCRKCPFRLDAPRYLSPQRYRQLAGALLEEGQSFWCHETIDYGDEGHARFDTTSRVCAGAMIWLRHQGRSNQVMQVMERLGVFDPQHLDMAAPVYATRAAFEGLLHAQAAEPEGPVGESSKTLHPPHVND